MNNVTALGGYAQTVGASGGWVMVSLSLVFLDLLMTLEFREVATVL